MENYKFVGNFFWKLLRYWKLFRYLGAVFLEIGQFVWNYKFKGTFDDKFAKNCVESEIRTHNLTGVNGAKHF